MLLIPNATNNWTKSRFFFYPHYTGEISKVVFKKTLSCNTHAKLDAILFAEQTLAIMGAFHTAYLCYKCERF